MTRFEQEISGALGEWWQKDAEREVDKAVKWATEEAIVEEDGAIRWASNGKYLHDDLCEKLEYKGYPFSREATAKKREEETRRFLEEYRKNPPKITPEMYAEMQAAFGEGEVVVDIFSGRKIRL